MSLCLQDCLQGFQSCQIYSSHLIQNRFCRQSNVAELSAQLQQSRLCFLIFHILLSQMKLKRYKVRNPATLCFVFFFIVYSSWISVLTVSLGELLCVCYDCVWVSVCVCLHTSVSNITVTCMFKSVLGENILRIIRLVQIKESFQMFFVKQKNCMWVLIYCESSMMYAVS